MQTQQKIGETEMELEGRLILDYSRFEGVYTQADQSKQFIENVSDTVSYDVLREKQAKPRLYEMLQTVMALADTYRQALRARQGNTRTT